MISLQVVCDIELKNWRLDNMKKETIYLVYYLDVGGHYTEPDKAFDNETDAFKYVDKMNASDKAACCGITYY